MSAPTRPPPRSPIRIVVSLVLGLALSGFFIHRSLDTHGELAGGALTTTIDRQTAKNRADRPIIEVAGTRYTCDEVSGLLVLGAPVRYDPQDPSRCRLEADLGQMTMTQWFRVGVWTVIGLGIIALGFRRPRVSSVRA